MTKEEFNRLNQLDEIIAWHNPTDGGRPLTEEEWKEHRALFCRIMSGEEVED